MPFFTIDICLWEKYIQQILNSEFNEDGVEIATFFRNDKRLFGGRSILFSNNKVEHG
jgi:hypothetical protein